MCVRNTQKNKACHFIVDRAARDPKHEKDTWSAVLKMFDLSAMATLVHVTYYSQSDTCDKHNAPDSKKFNPKLTLLHVGKEQSKNIMELSDYLNNEKRKKNSSLPYP